MRYQTRRAVIAAPIAALLVPSLLGHGAQPAAASSPIQHVVFLLQENHSFDNVLGTWCVQTGRCDGATTGKLSTGGTIPLSIATDKVVNVPHNRVAQTKAIDGGKMDGFDKIHGCGPSAYACFTQYQPSQIPNLISLATNNAVSDRTFELDAVPSWGMHLEAISGTLDGFYANGDPLPGKQGTLGPGWGCDSGYDSGWYTSTGAITNVPSCVPDYNLNSTTYPFGGAYRATPVPSVPTIMDRLDGAGLPWKLYVDLPGSAGNYGWAMCPTFAGCIDTQQKQNMISNLGFLSDARAGALPAFSVVTPTQKNSQHNGDGMATGDNWLGAAVQAIESGPDWASTAIFIAYDDCGCFYDHAAPPASLGIRVPMVIVSPFARPGFTDSTPASFASALAFTEHAFSLAPLSSADANAYDYNGAFNFALTPTRPLFRAVTTVVPLAELRAIAASPPDPSDPT
jgi:phospholipase C